MNNYVITGGDGFIGSRIVAKIGGKSYDIKSGNDILDDMTLEKGLNGCRGVFHCAAKISVPESFQIPEEYFRTNVEGLKRVVEQAKKAGARVVFSSSAAVYGESGGAVSEDFIMTPKSPYAENKRDGEVILKEAGIPAVALRYFNVYGPGQSPAYAGVITAFIKKALNNEDLTINGDGEQVRDFVFVDDVADANIAAMNYSGSKYDVFNVASGEKITINDLAKMIIKLTNSKSKIKYGPERIGDIVHSEADISKAIKILDWKPKVSIEEGLRRTIESYR